MAVDLNKINPPPKINLPKPGVSLPSSPSIMDPFKDSQRLQTCCKKKSNFDPNFLNIFYPPLVKTDKYLSEYLYAKVV